jgi:hypothetical protein
MRRTVAVLVCMVAILGVLAPAAFAQAPAPKVTINGLFDQVTSTGRNLYDGNFSRSREDEWYARTRFRPDFTFEVGRTKAVLGLEIDLQYGGCGTTGGDGSFGTGAAAGCKGGANGGLDLNTDVAGIIEIKWIYTEFDLTGKDSLMPFIPVQTTARIGGQPFASLANYRATYAAGDFAGLSAVTTWAPNLKTNLAYVMVQDETAATDRLPRAGVAGEDWAIIFSPEFTPFKGLDIKGLYSYFQADNTTSAAARRPIANAQGAVAPTSEQRHTIGVDARWRSGPFSLDPTFYYQWGDRDQAGMEADMSSFLADVQGGWQLGPLLLEVRGIYTPGNKATHDLRDKIRYYEPLNMDTNYYINWAQIMALGVDYFNGGGGTMQGMSTNVGYDRYGRMQFGLRATYSLTPELAFYGIVTPGWAEEKVDTDTTIAAGGVNRTAPTSSGDSRYLGTEVDLGTTWRFAPNTAFDLVGAYLFAGEALDTTDASGSRESKNAWTIAARVRLSF